MWGDENLLSRMRLAAINCAKLVPWWTQNWSSRGLWLSKMVDMIDLHNVSFPMGWTVATDKKYIQGVWVRASRYHRCSCKLLNVECMVPARDLDVGQHRTAILHRATCAEAVFLTRHLDWTLVHRGCTCFSVETTRLTFAYALCASTRCSRGRSIASMHTPARSRATVAGAGAHEPDYAPTRDFLKYPLTKRI